MNWVVELSEFGIEYVPRSSIKGQVLAVFIVEFTGFLDKVQDAPTVIPRQVFVDGSSCWAKGLWG